MNIKRLLALTLTVGALLISTACTAQAPTPESQTYTAYGTYCGGAVVTNDGNGWGYTDKTIDPNTPVIVHFNDNGTPDNIKDDVILGLVYDLNINY